MSGECFGDDNRLFVVLSPASLPPTARSRSATTTRPLASWWRRPLRWPPSTCTRGSSSTLRRGSIVSGRATMRRGWVADNRQVYGTGCVGGGLWHQPPFRACRGPYPPAPLLSEIFSRTGKPCFLNRTKTPPFGVGSCRGKPCNARAVLCHNH
jgi:hypothetical protein